MKRKYQIDQTYKLVNGDLTKVCLILWCEGDHWDAFLDQTGYTKEDCKVQQFDFGFEAKVDDMRFYITEIDEDGDIIPTRKNPEHRELQPFKSNKS